MRPVDIKNLRNLLSEEDKKLFDSSYEKISNLFLSQQFAMDVHINLQWMYILIVKFK